MTKTLVATPDPEERCTHTVRTIGGRTFVCVREVHRHDNDRHVMRRAEA